MTSQEIRQGVEQFEELVDLLCEDSNHDDINILLGKLWDKLYSGLGFIRLLLNDQAAYEEAEGYFIDDGYSVAFNVVVSAYRKAQHNDTLIITLNSTIDKQAEGIVFSLRVMKDFFIDS